MAHHPGPVDNSKSGKSTSRRWSSRTNWCTARPTQSICCPGENPCTCNLVSPRKISEATPSSTHGKAPRAGESSMKPAAAAKNASSATRAGRARACSTNGRPCSSSGTGRGNGENSTSSRLRGDANERFYGLGWGAFGFPDPFELDLSSRSTRDRSSSPTHRLGARVRSRGSIWSSSSGRARAPPRPAAAPFTVETGTRSLDLRLGAPQGTGSEAGTAFRSS